MDETFKTVRIRRELVNVIEKYLKSKQSKKHSFTNISQFVEESVRAKLDQLKLSRFEHTNLHENIIRVLDSEIGSTGDYVELVLIDDKIHCRFCEENDCVHIKFVWSDPKLSRNLIAHDLKSPF